MYILKFRCIALGVIIAGSIAGIARKEEEGASIPEMFRETHSKMLAQPGSLIMLVVPKQL